MQSFLFERSADRYYRYHSPLAQLFVQLNAKIYLWDWRRTYILPNIRGFQLKLRNKYEV